MSNAAMADPASLRDPNGRVYRVNDRVFRAVAPAGAQAFEAVWQAGILQKLRERGRMLSARLLEPGDPICADIDASAAYVLEHPLLPVITYPYEWPFSALKQAALAHLDMHLQLLEDGFTLSDASAFNMQFSKGRPLHIDALSVVPYREGEPWAGYRQFCRQFLYPLMFEAATGVSFTHFFRTTLEGVSGEELLRIMPWHAWLRPGFLLHAVLPVMGERRAWAACLSASRNRPKLPYKRMCGLLRHLRLLVEAQKFHAMETPWRDYKASGVYSAEALQVKQQVVQAFAHAYRPDLLLDMGCHQGEFAMLALEAGAAMVIGAESDRSAVEKAWMKAQGTEFLPLSVDIANPSPAQGRRGNERSAFASRVRPDALMAMAVVHHLAIGKNIPLPQVMDYLISAAPRGLIEFVPKSDPMVAEMLRFRADIFPDYTLDAVRALLAARSDIVRETLLPGSDRVIFEFIRSK